MAGEYEAPEGDADEPTTYAAAVGRVTVPSDEPDEPEDETVDEPAARVPGRRTSGLLITGRVVMGLMSAVTLVAMSFVWLRVDSLDDSKNTTDAISAAQQGAGPGAAEEDDGANDILIVGNDSRTDMQGRPLSAELLRELRTEATETLNTDTLILLRIPRDGSRGSAISIPRDTSVLVPNLGREEKINGAFGITKAEVMEKLVGAGEKDRAKINRESDDAGRAALIQAVQVLTGVRVDHYTEVSLYGFYLLTEVIDGVDVCLNHATSDPDSGASFAKGPQTVRGGDAVAFVRQRKNLPRGDLDRIVRQQTFLSSAMRKVLSGGLLADNAKLNALEDAVSKTVVMDDGLHFLELVGQAQALASGNVQFVTIPVEAVGARNDRGQSIIVVDLPKVHAFVADLLTPQAPRPAGRVAPSGFGLTAPAAAKAAQPAVPCVD
ncbi:LCP family protein [Actinophytocola glycyrrhizae]|uniref:LCP family protein n=1 Tax=Actinophytocola glycyrrhizae TaxID=2044873 RepID=A0ABV9RX73_9PSEU